jgi:7-cyano-7-deazaguanine synthase in queuosine biosynthesis
VRILLSFSAGLDSTALLWKALQEGHEVQPVWFDLENNQHVKKWELQAANAIIRKLRGEHDKLRSLETPFKIGVSKGPDWILPQAVFWQVGLIGYMQKFNPDEVWMGYVAGDDFFSHREEIETLSRALYNCTEDSVDKPMPPIVYPLRRIQKYKICKMLPDFLREMIWFCEESMDGKPCGRCLSCKRQKDECGWGFTEDDKDDPSVVCKQVEEAVESVIGNVGNVVDPNINH